MHKLPSFVYHVSLSDAWFQLHKLMDQLTMDRGRLGALWSYCTQYSIPGIVMLCYPQPKKCRGSGCSVVEQYSSTFVRDVRLGQPDFGKSGYVQTRSGTPSGYRPRG